MKIFLIFLLNVFLTLESFAYTEISTSNVMEDYRKGDMDKYKTDDLQSISREALVRRGIISSESQLTRQIATPVNSANIRSSITCSFVGNVHISEYSDRNAGVQPDTFAMRFSRV